MLSEIQVMSMTPAERPPLGPPKRLDLVEAIASSIYRLKSYNVAVFCDRIGAPAHPNSEADPFQSKMS